MRSGSKANTDQIKGVTPSRVIAAQVCADMRAGHMLDPSFERRLHFIDRRDRRWTQELLYGMLRRRAWLDAILRERIRGGFAKVDPDIIDLLRLGAYQLLSMGSVPAYAAIAQTVELAKARHGIGASKLVNAVLRRIDRERDDLSVTEPSDPVEALALEHSHPEWLVARWVERFGHEEAAQLLAANNQEAPIIVRPYGVSRSQLESSLNEDGVRTSQPSFGADSIRFDSGGHITELSAFEAGHFFVQDPAATAVIDYADIPSGVCAIDLCSAPGGKAFELSRKASKVIAADRSFVRLQRLVATINRMDARHVYPIVTDARFPALEPADVVLADVPCTGTGTLRRHPDARWRLKISDLAVMGMLQASILTAAAKIVKVGGLLIYSTCSIEPEENEDQVNRFLEAHPMFQLEPPAPSDTIPDVALDGGFLRVLPHQLGADGAFAARMRRIS